MAKRSLLHQSDDGVARWIISDDFQFRVNSFVRCVLGALTVALTMIAFAPSATAAGTGDGYGGTMSSLQAGFVSILVAKDITGSGGTLTARVNHARLSIDVPSISDSQEIQCIVALDRYSIGPPVDRIVPRAAVLLDFSVLDERHGSPLRTAPPVMITYSGRRISRDVHVSALDAGTLKAISSSVTGDGISFIASINQALVIFKAR
jgi:hypothetical protein